MRREMMLMLSSPHYIVAAMPIGFTLSTAELKCQSSTAMKHGKFLPLLHLCCSVHLFVLVFVAWVCRLPSRGLVEYGFRNLLLFQIFSDELKQITH